MSNRIPGAYNSAEATPTQGGINVFPLIIISVVLLCILGIIIALAIRKSKYKSFVHKHSSALASLKRINCEFSFATVDQFDFTASYDNENFYNDISALDYYVYSLVYKQKVISEAIRLSRQNAALYEKYKSRVRSECRMANFGTQALPPSEKLLKKVEKREFEKVLKIKPQQFSAHVLLKLTNINGDLKRTKSAYFYEDQTDDLIRRMRNRSGDFYKDEEIWNSICHVERGKVTNKLRFAIYARDGHRCLKCGRSTADLEIDHIFPISKGGKTTFDNLQTLCRSCNLKKSNTVESGGVIPARMKPKYSELCPHCSAPLLLKRGKYGNFLGCSNYPDCRYTKQL